MRGSIRKQSKSSWRITVSLGKDFATNKYTKYQETFRGTKRDAENRLAEIISELNKGITINPEKYTFGEFLDKWLKDYCQANLSDRSLYDYSYIVNEHIKPELGQIPLQKLRPIHVKDFYSKLRQEGRKDNKKSTGRGLSASYVKKIHAIIHESLNHAVRWELVYRNVADAVDPPRVVRKEVSPINEKEIDLLLRSIKGTPLYVPTYIAIATGMRLGEILGLKWEDVDLADGIITVKRAQKLNREPVADGIKYTIASGKPKSKNSNRSIDIPHALVKLLKNQIKQQKKNKLAYKPIYQDHDLVCCQLDGAPFHNSTLGTSFRKAARKVGLSISFHTLRHSHASLLLKHNENLKMISARLGHSGIGITGDIYAHLAPDAQKEAARKIDKILVNKH